MSKEIEWKVGEGVVLNGRIVTIEKITPSGILKIGTFSFRPDGLVRGAGYGRLLKLTPELEAAMADKRERQKVLLELHNLARAAETLSRDWSDNDRRRRPTAKLKQAVIDLHAAIEKANSDE